MARRVACLVLAALLLVPLVAGVAAAQTGPAPNPTPTEIGPVPGAPDGYPVKLNRGVVQRTILTYFSTLMFLFFVFAAVTVTREFRRPRRDVARQSQDAHPPARAA